MKQPNPIRLSTVLMVFLALTVCVFLATAASEPIQLFNGKDFTGWKLFVPEGDPERVWSVREGVIHCTGNPAGYMRTTTAYENYRLTFEWRWPGQGGNNGLLVHIQDKDEVWPKSIEGQLQHGHAGDFWVIGGAEFKEHVDQSTRRVIKRGESSEKPLGEWNQGVAVCDGDTFEMYVNGVLQNRATECTVTKGYIGFQSEGAPIEFRNITLEFLQR